MTSLEAMIRRASRMAEQMFAREGEVGGALCPRARRLKSLIEAGIRAEGG
jgi:hypothetical protein